MEKKKAVSNCDTCEYYDYDEYTDTYACMMNLDEDEFAKFTAKQYKECPYYKFYDEYKLVQKQN